MRRITSDSVRRYEAVFRGLLCLACDPTEVTHPMECGAIGVEVRVGGGIDTSVPHVCSGKSHCMSAACGKRHKR